MVIDTRAVVLAPKKRRWAFCHDDSLCWAKTRPELMDGNHMRDAPGAWPPLVMVPMPLHMALAYNLPMHFPTNNLQLITPLNHVCPNHPPPFGHLPLGSPPVGNPSVGNPPVGYPPLGNPQIGNPPVGHPPFGNPPIGNPPPPFGPNLHHPSQPASRGVHRMSQESADGAVVEDVPGPAQLAAEAAMHAASAEDGSPTTVTVQNSVHIKRKARKKRVRVESKSTVQTTSTNTIHVDNSVAVESTTDNSASIETAVHIDAAVDEVTMDSPRRKTPQREPQTESRSESPRYDYDHMEHENATILGQDAPGTWQKGTRRFNVTGESAAKVLAWVVENTSRKNSVVATDDLLLDGFHNWDAVHAGKQNDERQLQHTFVIARAQRRRALKVIPGFADIVAAAQNAIESMRLHDTPMTLEWLTGHILNQGDVNARFHWHQDINEERKEQGGRRDRRVKYTVIVKLNRGGCTSMQVCGQPEVFYHERGGSGVLFRSDLHHRTEKAEPGIWKMALFFGVFV